MSTEHTSAMQFKCDPGRDPARIPVILETLRQVWTSNPDLRLTQLIMNVAGVEEPCPSLYHKEDDAILNGLKQFL